MGDRFVDLLLDGYWFYLRCQDCRSHSHSEALMWLVAYKMVVTIVINIWPVIRNFYCIFFSLLDVYLTMQSAYCVYSSIAHLHRRKHLHKENKEWFPFTSFCSCLLPIHPCLKHDICNCYWWFIKLQIREAGFFTSEHELPQTIRIV